MRTEYKPTFGLLFGESVGIRSELVIKALQKKDIHDLATWVIIRDECDFEQDACITGLSADYTKIDSIDEVNVDEEKIWFIETFILPMIY